MPAPDEIALFAGRLNSVGAAYMITGSRRPTAWIRINVH